MVPHMSQHGLRKGHPHSRVSKLEKPRSSVQHHQAFIRAQLEGITITVTITCIREETFVGTTLKIEH